MSTVAEVAEVLTLEDAAAYLRVPVESVLRLATKDELPGRQVDGQWRFLRAGLADWLRGRSGRAILLSQAGALADDESLPEILNSIYAARGRPEAEEG
jgi:excisionase family DNA binding protein